MYDVWHGTDAMQLGHIKRNRGPDNYYDGSCCLSTPQLNVALARQKLAPVRYTSLNEANIRLDLPAYGPHI